MSKSNLIQMVWTTNQTKVKIDEIFQIWVFIINYSEKTLNLDFSENSVKFELDKNFKGQILNLRNFV